MTPDVIAAYSSDAARKRNRSGGNYLVAASVIHFIAIPLTLVVFKWIVEGQAGRSVSWGELFDALTVTGGLALVLAGVFGQLAFALVAGAGGFLLYRQRSGVWIPTVVMGVIALAFSLLLFGGFVGMIGGLLSIAGGVKAKPQVPSYQLPPPVGPPPYRPPSPP